MKPYFYVYRVSPNATGPTVRHETLRAAADEAYRLAEKHPGQSFEILKCVGFSKTASAMTFWMDGEQPYREP
jgi:hypothetical protein